MSRLGASLLLALTLAAPAGSAAEPRSPVAAPAGPAAVAAEVTPPAPARAPAEAPAPPPGPRAAAPHAPAASWTAWPSLAPPSPLLVATGLGALGLLGAVAFWPRRRGPKPRGPAPAPWLARWMCSARPAQERLEVLDRRALGPRESLVLLRWGPDRLLIGVTAAGVTVLARQPGTAAATPGPAPEEGAAGDGDFAAALADVAERGRAEEASLRDLMTRSRHRLLRLGLASSHARRERG